MLLLIANIILHLSFLTHKTGRITAAHSFDKNQQTEIDEDCRIHIHTQRVAHVHPHMHASFIYISPDCRLFEEP